ncbi:hypothetical protein CEXT_338211 [Caerostris extrusa]|uniref:Uncharacterized protein n=1 Tax=Caerostris extrusa TaxID=172846 RepID=A0AAV4VBW8_CAEEX|nr:hypothetical protein CEXT_338211 [Caerostris extrusa]
MMLYPNKHQHLQPLSLYTDGYLKRNRRWQVRRIPVLKLTGIPTHNRLYFELIRIDMAKQLWGMTLAARAAQLTPCG